MFYLPGVFTHTDTGRKQSPEYFKIFEKNTIFNELPVPWDVVLGAKNGNTDKVRDDKSYRDNSDRKFSISFFFMSMEAKHLPPI